MGVCSQILVSSARYWPSTSGAYVTRSGLFRDSRSRRRRLGAQRLGDASVLEPGDLVPSRFAVRLTLLDVASEGESPACDTVVSTSSSSQPALAATPDGFYLAWTERSLAGTVAADELRLERIAITGPSCDDVTLDGSALLLSRTESTDGDQRRAGLYGFAAPDIADGALLSAWEDFTGTSRGVRIVSNLLPTPLLP